MTEARIELAQIETQFPWYLPSMRKGALRALVPNSGFSSGTYSEVINEFIFR